MSKDMAGKVLLDDEQIKDSVHAPCEDGLKCPRGDFDCEKCKDTCIARAQLKAAVGYLEQPCTEHPIDGYVPEKLRAWNESICRWFYAHRRDCPECWENLKREAGVTGTTKPKPRS